MRKSTTSVRRTCKSLERKVTQVQSDFLLYKDQQEKQSTDLDCTSEQIETLQREKADLTRKVNGLKKEQIDNIEEYSRRQCLVFIGIEEEREEILIRSFWNFAEPRNNNLREPVGSLVKAGTPPNLIIKAKNGNIFSFNKQNKVL